VTDVGAQQRRGFSPGQIVAAAAATVVLSALVLRFILTTTGPLGFVGGAVRYFSFFTIISNILVAIVVTPVAFWPHSFLARLVTRPGFAGAVALYIIITGLIFNLLLRDLEVLTGFDQVCNLCLHYVMPVLYPIFWLLFIAKGTLRWTHALWWLIWPLAYAAISLIRGPIVGWWPYPFIDASIHSTWQLILNILGVSAGFIVVGLLLVLIDRLLGSFRLRQAPAA
jgi:hypothetical protein